MDGNRCGQTEVVKEGLLEVLVGLWPGLMDAGSSHLEQALEETIPGSLSSSQASLSSRMQITGNEGCGVDLMGSLIPRGPAQC